MRLFHFDMILMKQTQNDDVSNDFSNHTNDLQSSNLVEYIISYHNYNFQKCGINVSYNEDQLYRFANTLFLE